MLKTLPRSPVILAVILGVALVLWLLSGDHDSAQHSAPAAQQLPEKQLPLVETHWSEAQPYQATQVAQGQVLPWRSVSIKAQQAGRIEALLKLQGDAVQQGDDLLRISDEGRSTILAQAKANLTLRQTELASAKTLGKAQFLSATELTRLQSELAKAEAEMQTASLALRQTVPQAPFAGVIDRRHVEVGSLVQSGSELLQLVQIDKLKVTAQIPQQHIAAMHTGQQAQIRLLDGRSLQGELSFISYAADSATRSFYIEVTVDNPQQWRIAGASATVEILLDSVQAHRVSPALLSLADSGQLTIAVVDEKQQVMTYPVTILTVDNNGAWVSGLPQRARIITQGAGFVASGDKVRLGGAAL
ncbi:efflux RND transporter periplasmic adaptor subunit [Rheinheimera nanhaiensis]|uniref:RND family efflux transporter MFP subunit n=1 Tax=Rheinheimera nanhaiensis E407-8 TaxID=562729 RepID=I1DZ37_9GAMM|nr:efflux RND transporter periplasmic adaptor subunit [Rheinheimera nanhaiensis]GAB59315.1 RND family efflux transporter MFP subunit [Rheinheimera nanhaiensis E407-8]